MMKALVQLCVNANKPFRYFTCCGSADDMRDDKFGYKQVLDKVEDLGGKLVLQTASIPTALIEPPEEEKGAILVTEENFNGAFRERFEKVMDKVRLDEVESV